MKIVYITFSVHNVHSSEMDILFRSRYNFNITFFFHIKVPKTYTLTDAHTITSS
jgi:hypothetical protein